MVSKHPSLEPTSSRFLREMGIKRKASNLELDLNLSLSLESRINVIYKKLKDDFGTTRGTSTLDLTL